MLEGLWGKNTNKEGTTQEGRQRSGVFIDTSLRLATANWYFFGSCTRRRTTCRSDMSFDKKELQGSLLTFTYCQIAVFLPEKLQCFSCLANYSGVRINRRKSVNLLKLLTKMKYFFLEF